MKLVRRDGREITAGDTLVFEGERYEIAEVRPGLHDSELLTSTGESVTVRNDFYYSVIT